MKKVFSIIKHILLFMVIPLTLVFAMITGVSVYDLVKTDYDSETKIVEILENMPDERWSRHKHDFGFSLSDKHSPYDVANLYCHSYFPDLRIKGHIYLSPIGRWKLLRLCISLDNLLPKKKEVHNNINGLRKLKMGQ